MKKLIAISAIIAVCGASFAQTKAGEPVKVKPAAKTKVKVSNEAYCAVQGKKDKVNIAEATKKKLFTDYKGKRYYFCCPGCPEEFKKNPEKYAKANPGFPIPAKVAPVKKAK